MRSALKILVITISDRAFRGEYEDRCGPAVERIMRELIAGAEVSRELVPDDPEAIEGALSAGLGHDVIVTTGGTGLGPRDVTPEVTRRFCERSVPGIAEMLRRESLRQTATAVLSRGTAGVKDETLIVNLPGSLPGARFCARLVAPILSHAAEMIRGGGH